MCVFFPFGLSNLSKIRIADSSDRRMPGPRASGKTPWTRSADSPPPGGEGHPRRVPRGRKVVAGSCELDRSGRTVDQRHKGPSNSLRFREAAARFGSLSFVSNLEWTSTRSFGTPEARKSEQGPRVRAEGHLICVFLLLS